MGQREGVGQGEGGGTRGGGRGQGEGDGTRGGWIGHGEGGDTGQSSRCHKSHGGNAR